MNVAVYTSCYLRPKLSTYCLTRAITHAGIASIWLIIDDGNRNPVGKGIQARLETEHTRIEAREHAENKGIAVRQNEAAEWAKATGADVAVSLDADILCPPNWLRELAMQCLHGPHACLSGFVCNDDNIVRMLNGAGVNHLTHETGIVEVDGFGNACVARRREVIQTVRFNETRPVFAYEDADFNGQCQRAGFSLGIALCIPVWHLGRVVWEDEQYEMQKLKARHRANRGTDADWQRSWDREKGKTIGGAGNVD